MRRPLACLALAAVVSVSLVGPAAADGSRRPWILPHRPAPSRPPRPRRSPRPRRPTSGDRDARTEPARRPDAEPDRRAVGPPATEPTPETGRHAGRRPDVEPTTAPDADGDQPTLTAGRSGPDRSVSRDAAPGRDTAAVLDKHASATAPGRAQLLACLPRLHGQARQGQHQALLTDPNVVAVVPDEVIELASQTIPNGVPRVGGNTSAAAAINGLDARVDADVAIIDTGIATHPDLNIAGGYNCASSDRAALARQERPRHARGGHGRRDRQHGRRRRDRPGRPPVGRPHPQRRGLRSPVVVRLRSRLDPRPARSERFEPSADRVGEHERRQEGRRRRQLRDVQQGHPACRDLPGGERRHHGRGRGREREGQRQPLRPGGLQRGHHRFGPRRHGRQTGRSRRESLLFMGRLRQGRHVRRLQQLRQGRRPHRARQVHLVDVQGQHLRLPLGDEHGRPHRRRRGGALQGEPPVRDPGRGEGLAPVPRQPQVVHQHRPGFDPREAARRLEGGQARVVRVRGPRPGPRDG